MWMFHILKNYKMNYKVFQSCVLLLYFTEPTAPICRQGPYPNLCGYNGNEFNITETEDSEIVCNCQLVVVCSVINLTRECNSTVIQLESIEDATLPIQLNCNISPLESQALIPTLAILNRNGSELSVQVFADSLAGRYRISCTVPEISEEINKTSTSGWEIVEVTPREVFVDTEVKLKLKLNKNDDTLSNSTPAWCFVDTPDSNTEILSVVSTSEDQLTCSAFSPVIPGEFRVSLAYNSPHTSGKSIGVEVIAKHPIALRAEYDSDFQTLSIYFDANVELHSNCNDAFPKTLQECFGLGFECYTRGNILEVQMGSQFKIIDNLTISSENKICREGYDLSAVCLSALPANLFISKPKVLGPNLSFYVADACDDKKIQKHLGVRVLSFSSYRQAVPLQSQIFPAGKAQRKNLIMWRTMREIESKLSSRLILQINKTDIIPLFETFSTFDNVLDFDNSNLGSGASVSVYVSSSSTSSSLLAEAHVKFCRDLVPLFRYNWFINGRNLSEEGRLLSLSMLPPGKYTVKCLVVDYDFTETLGVGWSTAELLKNVEEVLVVPSELAVGTGDDIFFRAVTRHGNSVSWTCRTALGEQCFTRDKKLLSDLFDFTSPNISLPAGSLTFGDYIWTVESSGGAKTVKVFIKPGEVTISVEIPPVFVNPLHVILNGSLQRVKEPCHAEWSSVRQKGFNYLDLHTVGVEKIVIEEHLPEAEIPLAIPSSSLQADSLYLFKLQVFCPQSGSLRYMKIPIRTGAPPVVFPVIVEPLAGKAMTTNFWISGAEAHVHFQDYPLVFEWSYIDPCDAEILLGRGLSPRNFTTYLPPGPVKIMARVCDRNKICSTSVSPTITVIQVAEIRKENFDKSLNEVQYLMTSGDVREAFGLAVTMFKSLVLIAEFEIRKRVFSAVEETISRRIDDLTEKLHHDPNAVKLSLEFCEEAKIVTKYFRKNSAILTRLRDFRNSITNLSKSN